jgi:hypothetical protein
MAAREARVARDPFDEPVAFEDLLRGN